MARVSLIISGLPHKRTRADSAALNFHDKEFEEIILGQRDHGISSGAVLPVGCRYAEAYELTGLKCEVSRFFKAQGHKALAPFASFQKADLDAFCAHSSSSFFRY